LSARVSALELGRLEEQLRVAEKAQLLALELERSRAQFPDSSPIVGCGWKKARRWSYGWIIRYRFPGTELGLMHRFCRRRTGSTKEGTESSVPFPLGGCRE
jgi:hypothetical protein